MKKPWERSLSDFEFDQKFGPDYHLRENYVKYGDSLDRYKNDHIEDGNESLDQKAANATWEKENRGLRQMRYGLGDENQSLLDKQMDHENPEFPIE